MSKTEALPGHALPRQIQKSYKQQATIDGIREWSRDQGSIAVTHRCGKVHHFKLTDGKWKRIRGTK